MQKASNTAEMVAAVRAAYHYGPEASLFDDPYAINMLGPIFWLKCRVPVLRAHYMHQGMFRHYKSSLSVLSRARYCEDLLEASTDDGLAQYVLLGAGFDTFALRAGEVFRDLKVFEVDTAGSQSRKKKRIAACGTQPAVDHQFVAVDFTKERVEERLLEAGLDSEKPSFFSWQGVLIYLDHDSISRTLRGLASVSVPGSRIVTDFIDGRLFVDEFLETEPDLASDIRRLRAYTASQGEPIITGFEPHDFADFVKPTGWKMVHTITSRDHAARFLNGEPDYRWPTIYDHLVTLERV